MGDETAVGTNCSAVVVAIVAGNLSFTLNTPSAVSCLASLSTTVDSACTEVGTGIGAGASAWTGVCI